MDQKRHEKGISGSRGGKYAPTEKSTSGVTLDNNDHAANDELAFKRAAWGVLLARGGALGTRAGGSLDPLPVGRRPQVAFMSAEYEFSVATSIEVAEKLAAGVTIDLDESTEPSDDVSWVRQGTFSDETRVGCLHGVLALEDGSRYSWGAQTPEDVGFAETLRILSTAPNLESARERLIERCTDPDASWTFKSDCRLGD